VRIPRSRKRCSQGISSCVAGKASVASSSRPRRRPRSSPANDPHSQSAARAPPFVPQTLASLCFLLPPPPPPPRSPVAPTPQGPHVDKYLALLLVCRRWFRCVLDSGPRPWPRPSEDLGVGAPANGDFICSSSKANPNCFSKSTAPHLGMPPIRAPIYTKICHF